MQPSQPSNDSSPQVIKPVTVRAQSLSNSQPVTPVAPVPLTPTAPAEEAGYDSVAYQGNTNAPMVVNQILQGPVTLSVPALEVKKPNLFVQYWRKAGGGSFTASLLIHAGLLVAAYFIVETVVTEQKVDFLPGGGSKGGKEASEALASQVKMKKRQTMNQTQSFKRIVTDSMTASIALKDDMAVDTIDVPDVSSMMGSKSMGSGFGGSGMGGGLGSGVGTGNVKGFLARTFFGNLGGDGLPGVFYDLKQDRKGKPLTYDANAYFQKMKVFADKKFDPSEMKDYFRAPESMSFTFLGVPLMRAEEGPKAFAVDKHVQPRGWLVHYSGMITPPELGEWRFVGYFDDMLAVYIDGKPVLDASRDDLVNLGEQKRDDEIRQSFGGMNVLNGKCYAGKWFRMTGPAKIDIVLGERPGGQVGGLLLVENRKTKYKKRDNGTPILPLFATAQPDMEDLQRMQQFSEANKAFGLELKNIPIFTIGNNKPALGGGRMRPAGLGLLPPKEN